MHQTIACKVTTGALLFCLLLMNSVAAQQAPAGTVKGVVTGAEGLPLELAVITLLRQSDSGVVKGTMANSDGSFEILQVPAGEYFVKAAYMGYHAFLSPGFILSAQKAMTDMGTLQLSRNEQILGAVTITGRKQLVEQRPDRTVLNIEHSLLAEGNTALELLEKAPGVSVDDNGSISLKGKPGVTVMLNGKLTYLSQQELMHLLRGTASNAIAKIEIIPNPPARFDAAGTSGIINIVMKKSTRQGLNGNVYTNYARSRKDRYGAGMGLNYGGDNANVYMSYNHAFRGEKELLQQTRRFRDGGHSGPPDRISDQHIVTDEPLYTNNFKLGADYNADKNNTFGVLLNGNVGQYSNNSEAVNRFSGKGGGLLYDAGTESRLAQRWTNLSSNVNFLHKFGKAGRELSADLDYAYNDFQGKQHLTTQYKNEAGEELLPLSTRRGSIPSRTNVYVAKTDYTQTFWNNGKLEAGWKSSFVAVDNNSMFDTLQGRQWVNDAGTSNQFRYRETIHAGYLQAAKELSGWHMQLGLRGEYTAATGHQLTMDSMTVRRYFQLFPSLAVSKELPGKHKVQFTYSRRIERPDYDEMNPFRLFRDPYLFYQGNPGLQPALTNATELSYVLNDRFTAAVFYNHTANVVNWVMGQIDSLNLSYEQPQNLKSMINYGMSLNAALSAGSWWTGNYFFNLFHTTYRGEGQTAGLRTNNTGYTFNLQNSFQLKKGWSAELSAYYESSSVYGMFVAKPFYTLSAGVQKQFLDNRFTAKALVNDIFRSRRNRYSALFDNIDVDGLIRYDSRIATFSLSFRFGRQKTIQERKTGSEGIQDRVKSGG